MMEDRSKLLDVVDLLKGEVRPGDRLGTQTVAVVWENGPGVRRKLSARSITLHDWQ